MFISNTLLSWYHQHKRDLPWRNTNDPYKIWLSEIILQQTRVEQGLPYYEHFIITYPDVHSLASASEEQVMRSWQGLGYYSRARNLHHAAKQICEEHGGNFPADYNELLKLKGIGEYTAAAIASFAFGIPKPVLDGNVYRLISRLFGINSPIDLPKTKKEFLDILDDLIDADKPDQFNQAIMEFGAIQCKPQNPNCAICPFSEICVALKDGKVNLLPLKQGKIKKRNRYFQYLVIKHQDSIALSKRTEKDIWQHLYEFPMFESEKNIQEDEILDFLFSSKKISKESKILKISSPIKHVLSHQDIFARFIEIDDPHFYSRNAGKYLFIKDDKLRDFAFPRLIESYLQK